MPAHLYLAPAGGGKTTYFVERARALAAEPVAKERATPVRVVVPTYLQVRAWQRRLAEAGGALGVRVGIFDTLYRQVLREAGQVYTRLSDPVQYRLLRLLIGEANLAHYEPLRSAPGLVRVVLDLIRELKAGGVFEEKLTDAIVQMGNEPRLRELADLYTAYQERLRAEQWADAAGIGWLAQEALRDRPDVAADWPCVMVDGYDDLTSVQLAVLRELSQRDGELLIALTGALQGPPRPQAHKRFDNTRKRIESELGICAEPLPARPGRTSAFAGDAPSTTASQARPGHWDAPSTATSQTPGTTSQAPAEARAPGLTKAPALAHLEATLYAGETPKVAAGQSVALIAAPDREGEVRAALRWLKGRLIHDGVRPGEAALLARSMDAYRAHVEQIAAEYGIPVHVAGGLPLRGNPAVAALVDLLRLAAPGGSRPDARAGAYPWRATVEAWRSPYLDWTGTAGITPQDAQALDRVARWGSVVGGLAQWREAFDLLVQALAEDRPEALDEEMPPAPDVLPDAEAAQRLREKFERFVARIAPPEGAQPCGAFVRWIEGLIGDEAPPEQGPATDGGLAAYGCLTTDLGLVRAVLDGPPELIDRDREALIALKDALRGLVWAEGALGCAPDSFQAFLDDLQGAVNTTTYRLPHPADREAVLVADVTQARGVSYRAVAVLGLAEGEFPAALMEDPFLRDADRRRLRDDYGLQVDLTAEGAEAAYFYEGVTRPREWLLLTRPRIADNGAPWQASPYWEEVLRRVAVEPLELSGGSQPTVMEVASWPELLRAVGARTAGMEPGRTSAFAGDAPSTAPTLSSRDAVAAAKVLAESERLWGWAVAQDAARAAALEGASAILRQRATAEMPSPYDGDLTQWGETFARRYGPDHTWSASRLESYRTCPFDFFVGSVLGLEPRVAPAEGLDARQLGNLYHRIMEEVYRAADDPTDLDQLLEALPEVAAPILDDAPRREQFRATAWWEQTRLEILEDVRDSLRALDELRGEYVPSAFEQAFGVKDGAEAPLIVRGPADGPERGDTFRMRGLIDRVDRAPDGRVRIVDYKTGGPWSFTQRAFADGRKLQLPLYALAAREALGLGEIADGYYWHVRHAAWHLEKAHRTAWVSLAKLGVEESIRQAMTYVWETLRDVRAGRFAPRPPDDGCPDYCPATGFCWHYEGRGW